VACGAGTTAIAGVVVVMTAGGELHRLGSRDGAQQQCRNQHTCRERPPDSHLAQHWMRLPRFRLHFSRIPRFLWENKAESIHF
jgi:hypothetical protein